MRCNLTQKKIIASFLILLPLVFSACLKTRAQLRDDPRGEVSREPDSTTPAAPIHEVKPQEGYLIEEIKNEMTQLIGRMDDLERQQKEFHKTLGGEGSEGSGKKLTERLAEAEKAQRALEERLEKLEKSPALEDAESVFEKAEKFFAQKEFKKAIVEYSKFPEKFARSAHVPHALYKIAMAFEAMGMKNDAKGFYQELVDQYPKSPEAKKSRKKAK